jgi:hypothetical protein
MTEIEKEEAHRLKHKTIIPDGLVFDKFINGIPHYKWTIPFITGLHGCRCHPFNSWKECEAAEKQRFKPDDKVRHRCTGKEGVIADHPYDIPGYYLASNIGVCHAQELIPVSNQLNLL